MFLRPCLWITHACQTAVLEEGNKFLDAQVRVGVSFENEFSPFENVFLKY